MTLNELINHIIFCGTKNIQKVYKELLLIEKVVLNAPTTIQTHYHKLNEFNHPVYNAIDQALDKFDFLNAQPLKNKKNHKVQILFWFYNEISSCTSRQPCINGEVASHHASSKDRQKSILMSIELLKILIKRTYPIS